MVPLGRVTLDSAQRSERLTPRHEPGPRPSRARRSREASDFTVGVEEEFSILDPDTLDLAPRFEELRAAAAARPGAARAHHRRADLLGDRDHLRRRQPTCTTRSPASASGAARLFALAAAHGAALGATGTHPWADYREQPIIDTEHYRRVEEGLKYVAWRNNTFSLHVHVGVRDIDRAVRVCDRLRPVLPLLLAISANSPYLDGRDTGPALGAHAELHQELPPLRRARRVRRLAAPTASTSSSCCAPARSSSSRRSGGRCARTSASAPSRCASATRRRPRRSPTRSPALIVACVAQAARDVDEGVPFADPRAAADRGEHVAGDPLRPRRAPDRPRARRGVPGARGDRAPARVDGAGARRARASSSRFPERNGAQRQRRMIERGRHARGGLRGLGRRRREQTYSEEVTV